MRENPKSPDDFRRLMEKNFGDPEKKKEEIARMGEETERIKAETESMRQASEENIKQGTIDMWLKMLAKTEENIEKFKALELPPDIKQIALESFEKDRQRALEKLKDLGWQPDISEAGQSADTAGGQ